MTALYIKAGAILVLLIVLFGFGWYCGHLQGSAALARLQRDNAQAVAKAVETEQARAQAQAINDNAAEKTHDQDIKAIPLHIRHDPVFVRVPASCPVPSAKAEASGDHTVSGGVLSGPRERDIRPALEHLKAKYEVALADCRRLSAEWPQ